ncbi:hypothetical protein pb186bvf_020382 [Paramecium bursaria]
MNESRSTNLRTESDQGEKFQAIRRKTKLTFSALSQTLTARTFTQKKSNLNSPRPIKDDPILSQNPPFIPITKGSKNHFKKYLDGSISSLQLIQLANNPKLQLADHQENDEGINLSVLGNVLLFKNRLRPKQVKVDDRTQSLKVKVQKLNNLIKSKVQAKKQGNDFQRLQSLEKVGILKTMVDASEQFDNKVEDTFPTKNNPQLKRLRQIALSFEDMKSVIKNSLHTHQSPSFNLRVELLDSSKRFLQELESQRSQNEGRLLRMTKLQIEQQNKRHKTEHNYQYYHRNTQNQGILTLKDVKLWDYLHNPPQSPLQLQTLLNQENENFKINRNIKKRKELKQKNPEEGLQDLSHTSSLQSTYEIHLDQLYTQASDIKRTLQKKQSLPKKIKNMIKLDDITQQSVLASKLKLTH